MTAICTVSVALATLGGFTLALAAAAEPGPGSGEPGIVCRQAESPPASTARWLFSWSFGALDVPGFAPFGVTLYSDRMIELVFPDKTGKRTTCTRTLPDAVILRFRKQIESSRVCRLRGLEEGATKTRHDLVLSFGPPLACQLTIEGEKWKRSKAAQRVQKAMDWLQKTACASGCPERGESARRDPEWDEE